MTQIIHIIQKEQSEQTMTSLEIAELTGKQHNHLMRDIRKMEPAWEKVQSSKFGLSSRTYQLPNGGTKEVPCYQLTNTEKSKCCSVAVLQFKTQRLNIFYFLFDICCNERFLVGDERLFLPFVAGLSYFCSEKQSCNTKNKRMMKKAFLLLCLMATTNMMMATDLWEGTHAVAWDNTLTIEAAKFADAQVGQKIVVEFKDATGEVIELHSNGGMLPGTRYAHFLYADQHEMEVFITPGMLACLKEHGMEVCGTGFTATKLWYGDGKDQVDENTVWTGYFWMDEWSTLEIAKTSFDGVNWEDYKAIRFYSEANRTDYVINVLTKWGDGGKLGDQTTMTMTADYAELNLEGIDMAARLADVDRLMVQCNKEGGNPFNFTAIVLVKKETTGISDAARLNNNEQIINNKWYTLDGRRLDGMPGKGLYIVNGKKVLMK